ncbi:hypothetical protein SUGI_0624520 [Cryptomeria japonica]|nr:hypothetical protein SUGI_0624520 [Cryptomeria japonica]
MSGPPLLPSAEVFTPAITPINESVVSPASKPTNSENGKHNVFSSAKTFSEAVANTTVAASAKFCLSLQHENAEPATKKNTAPPANTDVVSPVLSPTPVTLINEQTSTKIAEPTIDVNMSDGFQEVKKKSDKKRRRKTKNSEARGNITNKANIPPMTPTTYDPPTHVDINPTPAEAKTFKEIEEGYYLEIVPAVKTNKIIIPTEPAKDNNMSALTLRSENANIFSKNSEADEDDLEWQKDFPRSKRRGRPPGSKNKSLGGFRTEELSSPNISNRTEGSMELIGVPTNNNFE